MSSQKMLNSFFKKIEYTYADKARSLQVLMEENACSNFLEEDDILKDNPHTEINFLFMLLRKLRIDFQQDNHFTKKILEEMLKGGHLKCNDKGLFYNDLLNNFSSNLKKRYSSHKSIQQQYSFSSPVLKEVLIGVSVDKEGNQSTWIQFERHHTKSVLQICLHLLDYIKHQWTGKNIGPFGKSSYTEKKPLFIVSPSGYDDKINRF